MIIGTFANYVYVVGIRPMVIVLVFSQISSVLASTFAKEVALPNPSQGVWTKATVRKAAQTIIVLP